MLKLVTGDFDAPADRMASALRSMADLVEGGLNVKHGLVVAVVDGAVSYAPLGEISLCEATGLLALASRKVERDLQ